MNGVYMIYLGIIMKQDKTELTLWEIYNNIKDLDDSDLEKAKAIINMEIKDRERSNKAE